MKYFYPNPELVKVSAKSIADDLNEQIDCAELSISPIKPKYITEEVGQEYVDSYEQIKENMIDESEEDLVDARMELAQRILDKYYK